MREVHMKTDSYIKITEEITNQEMNELLELD